jgi:hypothetical protein
MSRSKESKMQSNNLVTFDENDRIVELNRKVLIAAPIGGQKQYSINQWFEWIANNDYENFDICICVNGKDRHLLVEKLEQVEITHKYGAEKRIKILDLKNSDKLSVIQKITYSREKIRRFAVENGYDYIFFLDTDTIPVHLNVIQRLIAWNQQVVSGVYFYKGTRQPVIIDRWTHTNITLEMLEEAANKGELLEVWGFGFGCVLFRKDIFSVAKFDYDLFGEERTDDFGYVHVIEQLGVKRWLDSSILCQHLQNPEQENMKKEGKNLHFFWQKGETNEKIIKD